MLFNCTKLLEDAYKKEYAIGAYNVNNLEWIRFILESCQEDNAPTILAFSEKTVEYMGGYSVCVGVVKSLINDLNITIPVAIHLDHAHSFESCKKAVDSGFTSVMIDASDKPIDTNISITSKVTEYAHKKNVSVEAELGDIDNNSLCTIEDCKRFVFETNIDSLAPAIGNRHGFYDDDADLNYDLLGEISKEVKIPLVLHGGSFLDEKKIKTCIFCGVSKVNINTEIQYAWYNDLKDYINNNPKVYDPRKIIGSGKTGIKKVIHEKNMIFGSKNKAN